MTEEHFKAFHIEWITTGEHRTLLACRNGYPDEMMKFITQVAAVTCDNNSENNNARVVKVYLDDKSSCWQINIGSTENKDIRLEGILESIFSNIYNFGNIVVDVHIIDEQNTNSDSYNHMQYLSHELLINKGV